MREQHLVNNLKSGSVLCAEGYYINMNKSVSFRKMSILPYSLYTSQESKAKMSPRFNKVKTTGEVRERETDRETRDRDKETHRETGTERYTERQRDREKDILDQQHQL